MLGTALSTLKTMLKAEIGNELGVSTAQDTALAQLLNNTQRELAATYDWPHLHAHADATVSSQYTNLPATINFDRPVTAFVYDSETWMQLDYGIDPDTEYNTYDPGEGDTSSPLLRWQWFLNASGVHQFEVWPPPDGTYTVRFVGQKLISDMTDAVAASLDDLLLVYATAAKYLARLKSPQANFSAQQAANRLMQLRRAGPSRSEFVVIGGGQMTRLRRRATVATKNPLPIFGQTSPVFGQS